MDSRSSFNTYPWKKYFETLRLEEGVVVHLENHKVCNVQAMSYVCHTMFHNHGLLLQDLRRVLELRHNLLSIKMFDGLFSCWMCFNILVFDQFYDV